MKNAIVISSVLVLFAIGCAGKNDTPSASDAGAAESATHITAPEATPKDGGSGGPEGGNASDLPEPPPCTSQTDCKDTCPDGAKGCTCAPLPSGSKGCVPSCTTNADCKLSGAPALVCQNGICTPGGK